MRCISFTGSLEVGRQINEKCGRMMKRCSLELGSKNILIVMPDADLDLAVEAGAWGAFATSGQRCTATSRMAVHGSIYDEFAERLVKRVQAVQGRAPAPIPSTDLAPVINEKQKERVLYYIEIGQYEGAKLLTGGHALEDGEYAKGNFIAPTVFGGMTPNMRIAQEEIFGPVTGLIEIGSVDEAIEVANSVQYGLSASIYTHDINNTFKAIEKLEFGVVYINAPTIGAEVQLPFGGMKSTGNGHREAGPGRPRRVHRVEGGERGLLGQAPEVPGHRLNEDLPHRPAAATGSPDSDASIMIPPGETPGPGEGCSGAAQPRSLHGAPHGGRHRLLDSDTARGNGDAGPRRSRSRPGAGSPRRDRRRRAHGALRCGHRCLRLHPRHRDGPARP